MGGRGIPPNLETFESLKSVAAFDPFDQIEIIPRGIQIPDPAQHGVVEMLKILGIQELIEREGYQNAYAILNREHNAKRIMERYVRFKEEFAPVQQFDGVRLTETYRASVLRQITDSEQAGPIKSHGSIGNTSKIFSTCA